MYTNISTCTVQILHAPDETDGICTQDLYEWGDASVIRWSNNDATHFANQYGKVKLVTVIDALLHWVYMKWYLNWIQVMWKGSYTMTVIARN